MRRPLCSETRVFRASCYTVVTLPLHCHAVHNPVRSHLPAHTPCRADRVLSTYALLITPPYTITSSACGLAANDPHHCTASAPHRSGRWPCPFSIAPTCCSSSSWPSTISSPTSTSRLKVSYMRYIRSTYGTFAPYGIRSVMCGAKVSGARPHHAVTGKWTESASRVYGWSVDLHVLIVYFGSALL